MANLRWDGFLVSVRCPKPTAQGPAETLVAVAREQAALLVMGGCGDSRVREWIFGSFTRWVPQGAEVPVLIAD
jgi:nucleotide-binding universal stress UspA family protein